MIIGGLPIQVQVSSKEQFETRLNPAKTRIAHKRGHLKISEEEPRVTLLPPHLLSIKTITNGPTWWRIISYFQWWRSSCCNPRRDQMKMIIMFILLRCTPSDFTLALFFFSAFPRPASGGKPAVVVVAEQLLLFTSPSTSMLGQNFIFQRKNCCKIYFYNFITAILHQSCWDKTSFSNKDDYCKIYFCFLFNKFGRFLNWKQDKWSTMIWVIGTLSFVCLVLL